jgi:hypothetical protein
MIGDRNHKAPGWTFNGDGRFKRIKFFWKKFLRQRRRCVGKRDLRKA